MEITAAAVSTTRQGLRVAPSACAVVGAGAATLGAAAFRAASATTQTSATTIWASAWPQANNTSSIGLEQGEGRSLRSAKRGGGTEPQKARRLAKAPAGAISLKGFLLILSKQKPHI